MTQRKNRQARVLVVLFGLLLLAGGLAMFVTATASAQGVGLNQTTDEPETGERIDNNTVIIDSYYDAESGRAILEIRSDKLQYITLSDAGAFIDGGEISQNTVPIKAGDTQEVSVAATQVQGFVGVSVSTDRVLWAEKIKDIRKDRPPVSYQTAQLLALFAAVGTAGVTWRVVVSRRDEEEKDAERIL
jgi:hypothetical protein